MEKGLRTHEILRPFNVRPLYLVVKGADPKTRVAGTRAGNVQSGHELRGALPGKYAVQPAFPDVRFE